LPIEEITANAVFIPGISWLLRNCTGRRTNEKDGQQMIKHGIIPGNDLNHISKIPD
jgi:hypothetical protein